MLIREAVAADAPGSLAIYNSVIATSTAIYTEQAVSLEDRLDWLRDRQAQNYPVLVACDATGIGGHPSFGGFRARPGYRPTGRHGGYRQALLRAEGGGPNCTPPPL